MKTNETVQTGTEATNTIEEQITEVEGGLNTSFKEQVATCLGCEFDALPEGIGNQIDTLTTGLREAIRGHLKTQAEQAA